MLAFVFSASLALLPSARVSASRVQLAGVDSSRRHALTAAFASAALPLVALPAFASDVREIAPTTTRMGGKIDAYSDIARGWSIYKPTSWQKFDSAPGEYEAKWQDVVGVVESIVVTSSPVSEGKSIDALGTPAELGTKVAKLRTLNLVSSEAVKVGPLLMYIVELAGQGGHEVLGFGVSKGKLWRITAKASDKRWEANKEMYYNVITSFQTKIL